MAEGNKYDSYINLDNQLNVFWNHSLSISSMCCLLYRFLGGDSEEVLPSKGHRAVGKDTGKTSYIERFNNTMGQGKGNLVKKHYPFLKS